MSFNYIAAGWQNNTPIVLKLGLDIKGLKQEAMALRAFSQYGAVSLIAEQEGMLLLERALPGCSLAITFPHQEDVAIGVAADCMKRLHQAPSPATHCFGHVRRWLDALDEDNSFIKPCFLQKARNLREQLLTTATETVLLHGDLHHGNMLQHGNSWKVIDPKGVFGEPAYEIAAFLRNPMSKLFHEPDMLQIIHHRVAGFAKLLQIPEQRIINWCYVQTVVSWIWAKEDGCEVSYFQKLTEVLHQLT